MNTLFIGKNLLELSEVDSTNAFANSLLPSQPTEGTVIVAAYQTQGRGQQASTWVSQRGENLTFSLILFPRFLPPIKAFALNKLAALALHRCLKQLLPQEEVLIKWPNDVLVNRKKVAGILIENHLEPHGIKAAVIGIGLNVNQTSFPPEFQDRTTSLTLTTGQQFQPKALLDRILEQLEGLYLQLRSGRPEKLDFDYLQALYGYGEEIPVRILKPLETAGPTPPQKPPVQTVVLAGIDPGGRLALEIDRRLHYFQLKEVEFCL